MTRILPLVHDAATSGCGQPGEGAVRYAQRMAQHVARILASQQSQRIYLGRAPMAVTSKRERALQVVLVVLGLLTVLTNIYALVTYFLAGLRPTGGTAAPMFWTILAVLGVFLVLAARNPSAYRSLIAYAVWSSFAHTAVMAGLGVSPSPQTGRLPGRVGLARPGGGRAFAGAPS